jgi:hypothetical protein
MAEVNFLLINSNILVTPINYHFNSSYNLINENLFPVQDEPASMSLFLENSNFPDHAYNAVHRNLSTETLSSFPQKGRPNPEARLDSVYAGPQTTKTCPSNGACCVIVSLSILPWANYYQCLCLLVVACTTHQENS